ncbi:MAG TPA: TetR/AcrR family transcriptional regulator, partial [Candidatus Binataceae bacterium]|nr:TetR/AcrR family transcriptional regulator [Candidatus Binataceae bacterium]
MATNDSLERLMTAAERLFGERGIDGVSLRQINQAAGCANVAAIHYHFGSKEALVTALIERRMKGINTRRMAMLDEIEKTAGVDDLHGLIEAVVWPLAEQLNDSSGGNHYVQLLAQVYGDPRLPVAETFRGCFGQSVRRVEELIHQRLTYLPREIVATRFGLAGSQMIHTLADWERQLRTSRGKASP